MIKLSLDQEGVTLGRRTQALMVHDHLKGAPPRDFFPAEVGAVYSDPPWNPGMEVYFRRLADVSETEGFAAFWDGFLASVRICMERGARHVLIEQGAREDDRAPLMAAWTRLLEEECRTLLPDDGPLPFQRRYEVTYQGGRRPSALLHWGITPLIRDPSRLHGPAMTREALLGCGLPRGAWVVDPCTGQGMTSRVAHRLDLNFMGLELHPDRLQVAEDWLRRKGYTE